MNKVFEKIIERLGDLQEGLLTTNTDYNSYLIDAMVRARKTVRGVAEEYNNGWIPCSERLPGKEGKYITTSRIYYVPDHVDEPDNYIGIKISYYSKKSGWHDEEVFAWMTLPEPYHPKGE